MTTTATSLADIRSIMPDDGYNQLHQQQQELKPRIKLLIRKLETEQQELRKIQTQAKYRPTDRKLKKAAKLLAEQVTETELSLTDLRDLNNSITRKLDNILVERRRKELNEASRDYHFEIPQDDPLVAAVIAAAICESLQYQYVSGSSYYHWLIDQVAKRGDNGESAMPDGPGVPEINDQWVSKLDEMRKHREYLTILRMAAERTFKALEAEVPHDAPYVPKMLRRSDDDLQAYLDARKRSRWLDKQAQQKQVASAEHQFAKKEDSVYRPKL